jgi:hypothetical protein
MREFLLARGFTDDQMILMLDSYHWQDPRFPSYHNILAYMRWLVGPDHTGEPISAFLHYSGHGAQQQGPDGEYEDTICPRDYETTGMIGSGVLHQTLLGPLGQAGVLHCVLDCCHSVGKLIETQGG